MLIASIDEKSIWGENISRKTILYITMSLDGHIVVTNDQLRFLEPYEQIEFANHSYLELLDQIDTLIIGRQTYDIALLMQRSGFIHIVILMFFHLRLIKVMICYIH